MRKSVKAISILTAMVFTMLFTACESVEDTVVQANGTPLTEQTKQTEQQDSDPDTGSAEAAAEVSAADITSAIMAEIEIQSAVEKTVDDFGAFYDVDPGIIEDISVFICGSGAYPDELAVFKCVSNTADECEKAIKKRLESQLALYKDYTPDEVYKLEDAVIIKKDRWVIFIACSDNSRAKEIAEGLI